MIFKNNVFLNKEFAFKILCRYNSRFLRSSRPIVEHFTGIAKTQCEDLASKACFSPGQHFVGLVKYRGYGVSFLDKSCIPVGNTVKGVTSF